MPPFSTFNLHVCEPPNTNDSLAGIASILFSFRELFFFSKQNHHPLISYGLHAESNINVYIIYMYIYTYI